MEVEFLLFADQPLHSKVLKMKILLMLFSSREPIIQALQLS